MVFSLDLKDRKLLFELDQNSRQPASQLAKKLGLSKEAVNYRINRLRKEGVITKFTTIISVNKLGFVGFKVFIQFQDLSPKVEKEITRFLLGRKEIIWVAFCDGRWDLIFTVLAKNVYGFTKFYYLFLNRFSSYFLDKDFSPIVSVPVFRRDYLVKKKGATPKQEFFVGEPSEEKLDRIDLKILRIIANNARMPMVEIAERTDVSARVAAYRIKELIGKGIISGFRISIDLEKIGYQYFKAFISLREVNTKREKEFIQFCRFHPNIVYYVRCIGRWDAEPEFEVKSYQEFQKVMKEIRANFSNIIKGIESVQIREEVRLDYMPNAYPAEG